MWIKVGNARSKLARGTEEERVWLQGYLTFEGRRVGRAEPKATCLFNVFTHTFPSGFVPMVAKAAAAEGVKVELLDARTPPCVRDVNADLAWLRDYQLQGVEVGVRRGRGIMQLPTGAGKTELIVGLTRALPCKWLALVHRSQLADDIASRWEKRTPGLLAGRVLEGRFDVPDDAVLVSATYQSLGAALKRASTDPRHVRVKALLEEAEGLIGDEAHTAPAESFNALLMRTTGAYYRFGFSGTPLARGDARSQHAIAAFGPIIYQIKPQLLIDRGVLAKPTVRMATVNQTAGGSGSWATVYANLVVRSKARNAKLVSLAARASKPAFMFVEQMEHGRALVKGLFAAGMKAEFVWGTHSLDYRKSLIKRLVQGHFDVIVCSRIFNEGIDVPELRAIINAGGMKSVIATLQRLGRGMRVDRDDAGAVREGGDVFEVYDVMDTGNKWTERHARIRRDSYLSQGYETFVEA